MRERTLLVAGRPSDGDICRCRGALGIGAVGRVGLGASEGAAGVPEFDGTDPRGSGAVSTASADLSFSSATQPPHNGPRHESTCCNVGPRLRHPGTVVRTVYRRSVTRRAVCDLTP
jgi:hypothetical protein